MPIPPTLARTLAAGMLGVAMTGCQTPVPKVDVPAGWKLVPNELPLRFKAHSFGARCYNALDCSVIYESRDHIGQEGPFGPPREVTELSDWDGSHLGIQGFPPSPVLKWRSLDGTQHVMELDLRSIFKDGLVVHSVPESDIARTYQALPGDPAILVEINDRRVTVYMHAFIVLDRNDASGHNFRSEVVPAWTATL